MADLAYLLEGDPEEKITWRGHYAWGAEVKGSRRSIAHLEDTDQRARKKFGVGIEVLQSAYHTGYAPSEGTHDLDACYDVHIPGVDFWEQQRFFRALGWAAWYRYPSQGFTPHIHMISLGFTTKVGKYVDGGLSTAGYIYTSSQVRDYWNHALGLSGQHDSGDDPTWHPDNISATIFDYSAWKADLEDDMPYTEKQLSDLMRAAVKAEVAPLEQQIASLEEELKESRDAEARRFANIRTILKQRFGATDADLDELLGRP